MSVAKGHGFIVSIGPDWSVVMTMSCPDQDMGARRPCAVIRDGVAVDECAVDEMLQKQVAFTDALCSANPES